MPRRPVARQGKPAKPGVRVGRRLSQPKRLTLLLEASDHETLIRYRGWLEWKEGKELSLARVLLDALRENRRFRAWEAEQERSEGDVKPKDQA